MCRAVPTEALLGLVNQPLGDVNRLEGFGSINRTLIDALIRLSEH